MSKPVCLVTAPVATRSGYGAHSRDICRALIELDRYDVKIWPVRWGSCSMNALHEDDPNDKIIIDRMLQEPELPKQPELHFHIVIPNEFQQMGKYNIGVTAGLEKTVCPPQWIEGMNRMDMNIVPSTFVKDVMGNIGFDITDDKTNEVKGHLKVEKPIEVLFEGTDTNIFKKTKEFTQDLVTELKQVEETFNFLYVGHWLQGGLGEDRKDTGMLLKVFLETFKNKKKKPGLIMKTSGATVSILDREDILHKITDIKETIKGDLPNVYLLHGDLTDDEMNGLYNHPKVKAHVTLTHGEGYGRPLLEASISGKPVIYSEGSQWFTVNYPQASAVMKEVYDNYKKYTLNADKLSKINKSKFSLQAMTKELGKILDKYVPEFPKEVELKLPKLKKVGSTDQPKIKLPKLKKI